MDRVSFPLHKITDEQLIVRVGEECVELAKECFKILRFGDEKAWKKFRDELDDVKKCIEEVEARGLDK
jgi:hypothetical protein